MLLKDGDLRDEQLEFKLRRARIFVRAELTDWLGLLMATEGAGGAMSQIDGYLHFQPREDAQLFVGRNIVPGLGRMAGTPSTAALLAGDVPSLAYKNLSWGARGLTSFANDTIAGTDAGLGMDVSVRDEGLTFFGNRSLSPGMHLKYYAGVYDGHSDAPARREGDLRFSTRLALNLGDAEPGYYTPNTYRGRRQTVAVGLSYDAQNRVAYEAGTENTVDYRFWSVDFFAE